MNDDWWADAPLADAPAPAAPAATTEEEWWSAAPVVEAPEADPFAGESTGDLLARRGQQFASGLTETIAAVPEALAVAGAAADARSVASADVADARADSYESELNRINSRAAEIEAALGINGNPRPSRENRLDSEQRAALQAEYAELTSRRNQLNLAVGSGGLDAYRADAEGERESATVDGRVVPANERDIFGYGDAIRRGSEDIFGVPDPRDQSFWGQLASGAGSMAGIVGTTLATTAVAGPVAGVTVGAAQGSALNSSAIYREAIASGVDEEVAREAAGYAALAGATEIVPITRALNLLPPRLRSQARNALMQRIINIGRSAGEEAVQEGLVGVANNLIAQNFYDPERGWSEDVTEQMLIGAILGGGVGAAGNVRGGAREEPEPAASAAPPPAAPPPATIDTGEISQDQQAALGEATAENPAAPAAPSVEVAPDQAAALGASQPTQSRSAADIARSVLGTAPEAAPAASVPAAPAPVTPEVTPAPAPVEPATTPEQAGDTLETVPEAPATLAQQAADLSNPDNARMAFFVPRSTIEQEGYTPPRLTGSTRMLRLPDGSGVLYWNNRKTGGLTARDALAAYNDGLLGQMLGLGPFTKADVAESVARGNPEVAVTERTPDGVEVKAAAGTTETAPVQVAALEADAAPGNTVQVEDPAAVLAQRQIANREQASPAAQAAQGLAQAQEAAQERRFQVETRRRRAGPQAERALDQARERREGRLSLTPRTEAQPAPVTEAQPAPVQEPVQTSVQTPVQQAAPAPAAPAPAAPAPAAPAPAAPAPAAPAPTRGGARARRKGVTAIEAAGDRKETRDEGYEAVNERVKRGELNHVDEARARARVAGLSAERAAPKIEQARIAGEIFDKNVPAELIQVTDKAGKAALRGRLASAVNEATERGFEFTARPNFPVNANAVVWLNQSKMMLGKLRSDKASYDEIGRFLLDEHAIKSANDGDLLRQTRKEVGEQVKAPTGGTGDVDQVAAPVSGPADPDALDAADTAAVESQGETEAQAAEGLFSDVEDTGARVTASRRNVRIPMTEGPASEGRTISRDDPEFARLAAEALARFGDTAKPKAAAARETSQARTEKKPAPKESTKAKEIAERRQAETKAAAETRKSELATAKEAASERRKREIAEANAWLAANRFTKSDNPFTNAASIDPAESRAKLEVRLDDTLPLGRDSAADARGDLERNGQEVDLAEATVSFSDARKQFANDRALGDMFQVLRAFTDTQLRTQRAVADTIFKAFGRVIGDVKIHILDDATFDRFAPNADGYYNPKGDYIAIRASVILDPTATLHTILHEGAHAVFESAMQKNPQLKQQVEMLRRMAQTHAMATDYDFSQYGFTDASEFLAEAWSNPQFQQFLAGVPITKEARQELGIKGPETIQVKSVWHWLKARLADLLGIKQALTSAGYSPGTRSVLEAAMDVGGVLMERAPTARTEALTNPQPLPAKRSKPPADSVAGKLMAKGVPQQQAVEAAAVIETEFEGKATDAQIDALATALKESFATQAKADAAKARAAKKYSRARVKAEIAAKKSQDQIGEAAKADFVPGKNPGNPRLLKLLTNLQIAEIADRFFGRDSNPIRTIARAIEQRRQLKSRYVKEMGPVIDKIAAAQKKHSRKQWEEFTSLIHDVTTAEVHPDRTLAQNKHLGKKVLKNTWKKAQHAELSARYNRLPQDLKDLYAETRDTLTNAQNQMSLKIIENILKKVGIDDMSIAKRFHEDNATDADWALLGEELSAHIEAVSELKKIQGPYFNLARRGDFVVQGTYEVTVPKNGKAIEPNVIEFKTREEAESYAEQQDLRSEIKSVYVDKNTGERFGIDKDGTEVRISKNDVDAEQRFRVTVQNKHVEFLDSVGEARRRADELRAAGVKVKDVEPKRYEREAPNAEMLSDQMRTLMATVDTRAAMSDLSDAQKAELRATLNEVSLRYLGSTRIQSSRLPRRYIEGASRDLARNTLDYVDSTAGYLARLDTQPTVEDAMLEAERRVEDISSRGTGSGFGARKILNEISERVLDVRYHDAEGFWSRLTNRLTTASFVDNLASPGYSIVNSLQVAMLTLPTLSGRFGAVRSTYQVNKAYRDVSAARVVGGGALDTVKALVGRKADGDRFIDDIKGRLKEKRERDMLDSLVEAGLIDANANLEVERALRRRGAAGALIDAPLGYLENVARAVPQAVEAINRSVSALAAYRMMYAKTKDHALSVQYAEEVVHESQGLYSNSNAAPIFNHPVGRLALQFKKYPQLVYYTLGKNVGRSLKPMNKGDRAAGIKTLAYIAASHGALAGITGMLPWEFLKIPLMIFSGIAEALGADAPDWEDFEDEVEEFTRQVTGSDTLAEMLTFGAPRGLGIDLNTRVGLQNLLIFGEPRGNDARDWKAYLFDTIVGAPGRTVTDMTGGAVALLEGDLDRAAAGLVPFKGIADVSRALNQSASGRFNDSDFVLRVMGLQSARQAEIQRDIGREIRENRDRRDDRSRLEQRFMRATTPEEIARATSAIRTYNRNLPEGSRPISLDALRRYRRNDMLRYAD